jgi:hypothetical protein
MTAYTELRLRKRLDQEKLASVKGKVLGDDSYDVLLTGPSRVYMPGGSKLLATYLPGVLKDHMDEAYPVLTKIRGKTDNRGLASGSERVRGNGVNRTRAKPIMSSILGSFDATGPNQYCRLTAFTAKQSGEWRELFPLFQSIAKEFESFVPDRYANQVRYANRTEQDWLIPDTPFTTITINNTYPTGVHTDKGDLDEGFSCLASARKGDWTGGRLVFPEWRVAVDMQHGDLMLMDAHQWHGNTAIRCSCPDKQELITLGEPCKDCGAERISVVCYYRTRMQECGSLGQELERQEQQRAKQLQ